MLFTTQDQVSCKNWILGSLKFMTYNAMMPTAKGYEVNSTKTIIEKEVPCFEDVMAYISVLSI